MPVPIIKNITGLKPLAAPNLYSAHIAALASFSTTIGREKSRSKRSPKFTKFQFEIFGAEITVLRSEEIKAAQLIPIPDASDLLFSSLITSHI